MHLQPPIDDLLRALPGAHAAALMGFDGLPVALARADTVIDDVAAWLTEYAEALLALRRAAKEVPGAGAPKVAILRTERATVLMQPLHRDYYVAVIQPAEAPVGRAELYMAAAGRALAQEL